MIAMWYGGQNFVAPASTTQYLNFFCGTARGSTTETNEQTKVYFNGEVSKLFVRLFANAASGGNSTIRFRKNTADGNVNVTIPASATGTFEDLTNTDTFASSDLINFKEVVASGGNLTNFVLSAQVKADTGRQFVINTSQDRTFNLGVAGSYYTGLFDGASIPTSTDAQARVAWAGTASKARIIVTSNTRSNASPWTLQKNGTNTSSVISIPNGGTGSFEDTSNTVAFAAGDMWSVNDITLGAGLIAVSIATYHYLTDSPYDHVIGSGLAIVITMAAGNTVYYAMNTGQRDATETLCKQPSRLSGTWSNLWIRVPTNSLSVGATVTDRVNGANGNQSISIGAGATGAFEDTTNRTRISRTSDINLRVATSAGSGSMSPRNMTMKFTLSSGQLPLVGVG